MREHRGPRGVRFPEKPFRITEVDRGVPGAVFYATGVKGARELVAWFCDPRATPKWRSASSG